MEIGTFDYILSKISKRLEPTYVQPRRDPITSSQKLVITLRFLAIRKPFTALAFLFRMAAASVASIIKATLKALWEELQGKHMPQPDQEGMNKISEEFLELWQFPNCCGAIDGKHVAIKCPAHSGKKYLNYKKYHSNHLQAVADAKCKFIAVEVGGYGSHSDATVLRSCEVFKHLLAGSFLPPPKLLPGADVAMPHFLIGDVGYPLLDSLITPFSTVAASVCQNEYFNSRLSRARVCIERSFGILTGKWRILMQPSFVQLIVKCCILHNVLIDLEGRKDKMKGNYSIKNSNDDINCNVDKSLQLNTSNSLGGSVVRDVLRDFLFWEKFSQTKQGNREKRPLLEHVLLANSE